MTIIVHDHGDPSPAVAVVEAPVHLVVEVAPPSPPPTVKEVATVVDLAEVVSKKKSP